MSDQLKKTLNDYVDALGEIVLLLDRAYILRDITEDDNGLYYVLERIDGEIQKYSGVLEIQPLKGKIENYNELKNIFRINSPFKDMPTLGASLEKFGLDQKVLKNPPEKTSNLVWVACKNVEAREFDSREEAMSFSSPAEAVEVPQYPSNYNIRWGMAICDYNRRVANYIQDECFCDPSTQDFSMLSRADLIESIIEDALDKAELVHDSKKSAVIDNHVRVSIMNSFKW